MDEPPREPNNPSGDDAVRDLRAVLEDIVPDMLNILRSPPPAPYPPVTYHRGAYADFERPQSLENEDSDDAWKADELDDEEDRTWVRFLIRLVRHFGSRATNFAHHYYLGDDPDELGAQAAAATGGTYEDTPYWTQGHGDSQRVLEYLAGLEPAVPLSFPFYSLLPYEAGSATAILDMSYGAERIGIYDIRDGDEAFINRVAPPGLHIEIYTHHSTRSY